MREARHSDVRNTLEGQLVGTPRYLSPEQACGDPVTAQTDVYSLGVVAYELLLGTLPFDSESPRDLLAMHLWTEPPPPRSLWPEIPGALDALLRGMLAKDPDARPTMRQVATALASARDKLGEPVPPPANDEERDVVIEPRRRRPHRRLLAFAGISAIATALAFAAIDGDPEARPEEKPSPAVTTPVAPAATPATSARTTPAASRTPAPPTRVSRPLPQRELGVVEYCPDPSLLRDGDQWLMTCTGRRGDNIYPIHTSSDLRTWRRAGFIFTSETRPTWAAGHYWAPELRRTADGFAAYFSMRVEGGRNAIGMATSTSARGPFLDRGEPLYAPRAGASDAHVFAEGGRTFLFHRSKSARATLWVQELADDGTTIGDARQVLAATEPWELGNVEAPAVMRVGEYVYLFFSGAAYCDGTYAIGVARARSPLGPFEKQLAPLARSGDAWFGPGHASVATTASGEHVIAYHAYRASEGEPTCVRGAPVDNNARHARIDRLVFTDGWPRLATQL